MFGFGIGEIPAVRLSYFLTPEVRLALVAGIIGAMPVVPALRVRAEQALQPWRGVLAEAAGAVALVGIFLASILQVAARTYNPFIYFRF